MQHNRNSRGSVFNERSCITPYTYIICLRIVSRPFNCCTLAAITSCSIYCCKTPDNIICRRARRRRGVGRQLSVRNASVQTPSGRIYDRIVPRTPRRLRIVQYFQNFNGYYKKFPRGEEIPSTLGYVWQSAIFLLKIDATFAIIEIFL